VWREHHAPLLYDTIASRKLLWPTQVVQWGQPRAASAADVPAAVRGVVAPHTARQLFISERTGDTRDPNTLLTYHVHLPVAGTTRPADVTRTWVDKGTVLGGGTADDDAAGAAAGRPGGDVISAAAAAGGGTDWSLVHRIVHPGEVNRVREAGPQLLVTHTDAPELFVWGLRSQPHRRVREGPRPSVADIVLKGHTDNAEYALKCRRADGGAEVLVASGGSDSAVLLWDIRDADGATLKGGGGGGGGGGTTPASGPPGGAGQGVAAAAAAGGRHLLPRSRFTGHTGNVEDVAFSPLDANMLASVSDDSSLRLWDRRAPRAAMAVVPGAHTGDVFVVDWSHHGCLLTGGVDGLIKVWEPRKLVAAAASGGGGVTTGSAASAVPAGGGAPPPGAASTAAPAPVLTLAEHTAEINAASWHDARPLVFASSAADAQVLVWDVARVWATAPPPPVSPAGPAAAAGRPVSVGTSTPAVAFRHVGHPGSVVDFQWLPDAADPWAATSVSEDSEGSTLQVWRMCELVMAAPDRAAARMLDAEATRAGVGGRAAAAAANAAIAANSGR